MKSVGLITEYNPLHNGHLYHLQHAKELTGADIVIVLMSGNWVQRGLPAIVDKWQRAQAALSAGADLVFELPFYYAVQSGDIFADGAVKLLADLQVDTIVCGAEHSDTDFITLARQAPDDQGQAQFDAKNQTYASNFAAALAKKSGFYLEDANDILAFSYARAIVNQGLEDRLALKTIARIGASYHDETANTERIASATAIRNILSQGGDASAYTPMKNLVFKEYETELFQLLRYRLSTDGYGQLRGIYQVSEGMEYLFKQAMEQNPKDFQSFLSMIKSKRYTFARLHRVLAYILMNIKVDQMNLAMNHPYHRLLAFNDAGRSYLHENKPNFAFPTISHVDQKRAVKELNIDYKADLVYQQIMAVPQGQDVARTPIQK
ncbi:MAG: nucleotidyltransferase [Oenococcus sp.]|uniref:nucleotidyltransferase n=1 Tax=Oenococcus sp. TaxID=1979414 RepID=UPI0039E73D3F